MNKNMKRLLSVLLSVVIVTGMLSAGAVFAADNSGSGKSSSGKSSSGSSSSGSSGSDTNEILMEEIARQLNDRSKDPFAFRTGKGLKNGMRLNSDLPEKFDLSAKFIKDGDETSYVTPVKFQNPFGTCWGFAAIAAAETSILGDGLAPGYGAKADPEKGIKELNLSEKHLVNFQVKPLDDPASSQNGEGTYFLDESLTLTDKFNAGGIPIYATSLFASGMGPRREDKNIPAGMPEDIYEYKGLNGIIEQNKVDGKWADYCYSDEDDWDIPESLRFKQSFTLEESYMLPAPAKNLAEDPGDKPVYEYDPLATEAIKEQLIEKRAVEIGFHADQSRPNQETDGTYISRNWAHYTDDISVGANHAVTIVGWDDTYPKENFVEGKQPPENGAWLVKNSWGSGEEEFPNKGPGNWGIPVDKLDDEGKPVLDEKGNNVKVGSGYFWLSYYDQTISLPEALKFNSEVPTGGYYLDQYDFMPVSEIVTADLEYKISMSNVFRAEGAEQLEYISCQTAAPGSTVEYEVYLLQPDYKDPADGVKVASGNGGPFAYGGFHKVKVTDNVIIQKDQYYSIIITQKTPAGEYTLNIQTGNTKEMAEFSEEMCWQKGIINQRESFVDLNGTWYDYSDKDFQHKVMDGMEYFFSLDNLPIKGYCKKLQDLNMYLLGDNPVDLPPYNIEWTGMTPISKTLAVRFRKGQGAVMPEDPAITWTAAPGSEGIFNIAVNEKDSSKCTISAAKPGTGYLVAACEGVGTLAVRVDVPKSGWYDVWDVGTKEYGESEHIMVNYPDGSPVPASEFKFTSDDPKVATVSADGLVKAVGVGKTVIRAADKNGVEEQIRIKVVKAYQNMKVSGKSCTVKASAVSSKSKTVKRSKVIKIKGAKGSLSFFKKKGSKNITVNKKNGNVTIKKGTKPGKYTVKVKVTAKGNKNYRKASETVSFKVIVK